MKDPALPITALLLTPPPPRSPPHLPPLKWRPLVSTCPLQLTQNQMCGGFDVDQNLFWVSRATRAWNWPEQSHNTDRPAFQYRRQIKWWKMWILWPSWPWLDQSCAREDWCSPPLGFQFLLSRETLNGWQNRTPQSVFIKPALQSVVDGKYMLVYCYLFWERETFAA